MTLKKDNFVQAESAHPPPLKGTWSLTQIQIDTQSIETPIMKILVHLMVYHTCHGLAQIFFFPLV